MNIPSGDGGDGVGSGVRARGGQASVADGRAGVDASSQLEDGNVAVESAAREAGVDLDRGDLDKGTSGALVLRRLLASSSEYPQIVGCCCRSKTESWSHLPGIQRGP